MSRPKLCGNCGKLMGIDPVCPYCGSSRNDIRQLKSKFRILASSHSVTKLLIFSNVLVYLFTFFLGLIFAGFTGPVFSWLLWGPRYDVFFGQAIFSSPAVLTGSWMSLFTANFLHMGIFHIGFNMYYLHIFGRELERELGAFDYWILYLMAGVGGFFVSALAGNISGGASAAIFGLLGAHMAIAYQRGGGFGDPIFQSLMQSALIMIVLGWLIPQIDNYAHGGGLVFGGLMMSVLVNLRTLPVWRSLRVIVGGVFILIVLSGFAIPLYALMERFS